MARLKIFLARSRDSLSQARTGNKTRDQDKVSSLCHPHHPILKYGCSFARSLTLLYLFLPSFVRTESLCSPNLRIAPRSLGIHPFSITNSSAAQLTQQHSRRISTTAVSQPSSQNAYPRSLSHPNHVIIQREKVMASVDDTSHAGHVVGTRP